MNRPQEKPAEPELPDETVIRALGLDRSANGRGRGFWTIVVVLAISLGAIAVYATQTLTSRPLEYKTTAALQGDLKVTVTATGTLEPINQVEVGSEISGIVRTVHVDFNDVVEAGQVLAHLDASQLEAKVRQSQASLEAAEALVQEAQATLGEARARAIRATELFERQHVSQQELEVAIAAQARAKAALVSAKAQLRVRRATLDSDQTTLSKTIIRTPISGIVISRNIEAGQTVAASFQTPILFTLAENLTSMELHLDIDEADISQVRTEQDAEFSVDAFPERRFPATITSLRVAPRTLQGVVTYEALLFVENPDLLLRPGMTATADIHTDHRHNVLLVPNAALRITPPGEEAEQVLQTYGASTRRQRQVWMLRDGKPVPIPVTTGATDGRWTEITGGELVAGTPLLVDIAREEE